MSSRAGQLECGRIDTSSRKGRFGELPKAVQNAVRGQAGIARVEDIDIVTRNGQTNYNVAFKREGKPLNSGWTRPAICSPTASRRSASAVSQVRAPLSAASKVTFGGAAGRPNGFGRLRARR